MTPRAAIILAAGEGKRMKSGLPKVLNPIGGRPMILHVLESACRAGLDPRIVVVGVGREQVIDALSGHDVAFAVQAEQLGTGHAVEMAAPLLEGFAGTVAVLYGDVPLLSTRTLTALLRTHEEGRFAAVVLTMRPEDPTGYGRIYRNAAGELEKIVEQRDLPPGETHPTEVNSGTYCFDWPLVRPLLKLLKNDNEQGEYYLTDTIGMLRERGHRVGAYLTQDAIETSGVNDAAQLAALDAAFRGRAGETE